MGDGIWALAGLTVERHQDGENGKFSIRNTNVTLKYSKTSLSDVNLGGVVYLWLSLNGAAMNSSGRRVVT
jgi:hypothetical protein